MSNAPLLMTEEFWANSQLSIARYFGEIIFNGRKYIIVDKHGRDIYELSAIANREGRQKAIEPGEPADLILSTLRFAYRKELELKLNIYNRKMKITCGKEVRNDNTRF